MLGEQAKADQEVSFAAAHGLLEMENRLRRSTGQTRDALADQVLHALGDVRLLEERRAISLGRNQLIKLLDLIAELDGECIRLKLACVAYCLHDLVSRVSSILFAA